jgi:hypothetical protein
MKNRFQNLPFKFQLAELHRGGNNPRWRGYAFIRSLQRASGWAVQVESPVVTLRLKAPGFNPWTCNVISWFQSLLA